MKYEVKAEVDEELSADPSYIVRYQVFEGENFVGDGIVQYHRQAKINDIPLTGIPGEQELSEAEKRYIRHQIISAVLDYMDKKGCGITG